VAFPRRLLNPGEVVVVDVHQHWWYLSAPAAALVAALAGGIAALSVSAPEAVDAIVLAVLLVALVWLLARYLKWITISLVVTSRRVVWRRGILRRRTREIPLEHLSDISVAQSLWERTIGAGSLVLESAGRESREVFPCLPHPAGIQNEIYNQMDSRAMAGPGGLSVPEQLEKLDDLRRRGVISDAEFDAEKDRLLDRR
jgi:membrane protein YdbS with pleckstrin-like domain